MWTRSLFLEKTSVKREVMLQFGADTYFLYLYLTHTYAYLFDRTLTYLSEPDL